MSRLALCVLAAASAAVAAPASAQPEWSRAARVEVKLANFSYTPSAIHPWRCGAEWSSGCRFRFTSITTNR